MATSKPIQIAAVERQALKTDFAGDSSLKYLIDLTTNPTTSGPWSHISHYFHFIPDAFADGPLQIKILAAPTVPADENDFSLVASDQLWLPNQPFEMDYQNKTGGKIADASPTGTGLSGNPLLLDNGAGGAFPGGLNPFDIIRIGGSPVEYRVVVSFNATPSPDEAVVDQAIGTHADNDDVEVWQGLIIDLEVRGQSAQQVQVINSDSSNARDAQAFQYWTTGIGGQEVT